MPAELAGFITWTKLTNWHERLKKMSLKRLVFWNTLSEKVACLHLGKEMIGLICC